MEVIETKHGLSYKCSRDEFEEIKAAILKGLDEDDKGETTQDSGPIRDL